MERWTKTTAGLSRGSWGSERKPAEGGGLTPGPRADRRVFRGQFLRQKVGVFFSWGTFRDEQTKKRTVSFFVCERQLAPRQKLEKVETLGENSNTPNYIIICNFLWYHSLRRGHCLLLYFVRLPWDRRGLYFTNKRNEAHGGSTGLSNSRTVGRDWELGWGSGVSVVGVSFSFLPWLVHTPPHDAQSVPSHGQRSWSLTFLGPLSQRLHLFAFRGLTSWQMQPQLWGNQSLTSF